MRGLKKRKTMKHKDTSPARIDELLDNLIEFPHTGGRKRINPDVQLSINSPTKERLMPDYVARPELDAKLETIETKMDSRLARIEDRFNSIDKRFESMDGQFKEIRSALEAQKNTAWKAAGATILATLGAALTILFGIAAFNATLLSNMTSSFDSGRDTAKMTSEAQSEISASVAEVKQMIQELKSQ